MFDAILERNVSRSLGRLSEEMHSAPLNKAYKKAVTEYRHSLVGNPVDPVYLMYAAVIDGVDVLGHLLTTNKVTN